MRRAWALALGLALVGGPLQGQDRPQLRVSDGHTDRSVVLATTRGWLAVNVQELGALGWSVTIGPFGATMEGPGGTRVEVRDGTPFVLWDGAPLQMVAIPYFDAGELLVPLQFVSDFLPWHLPQQYSFDGPTLTLRMEGVGPGDDLHMIIIDAGHGGADPGSISKGGIREKTVALGVAMALARALEGRPGLEVRLIRDDDTFVPLWDRGAIATEMKGELPGVFISVHANSFTNSARGFETYFLSDARTEHERRVAAIENAPIGHEGGSTPAGGDLDFILRDMKKLGTQHWSSLLAELVQTEMAKMHPGPNRGVKQAPLAVITNALMPSVLVEVGYLSHPEEARLLGGQKFQDDAGRAIADAVLQFFERYPPRAGGGAGDGR